MEQAPNGACVDVSNGARQQYADDFYIPRGKAQRLRRLVVTGVYEFANEPPDHDAYTVQVHGQWFGSDLPDVRHPPLCTLANQEPFFRVPTGRVVNGLEVYELTYYLGDDCVLPANDTYWLEVMDADGERGNSFAWECADPDHERGMVGSAVALAGTPGRDWLVAGEDFSIALDASDVDMLDRITGRVKGATGALARCINVTRSQKLDIPLDAAHKTTWDCTAAGLEAAPGDEIVQLLYGVVVAPKAVIGAATGEQAQQVQCINTTSGQVVNAQEDDAREWNCSASGFLAEPGDGMIHVRVGLAQ